MPCDTVFRRNQTIAARKAEIAKATKEIAARLARGIVKAVVGKQGAIAFTGIPDDVRDGMTDACIYRRIMATGSVFARGEIEKAARLAGVNINRQVIGQGVHSHDGGETWHGKG